MCAFLVEAEQEGITHGPWIKKMGLNANHQTSFYFGHVKIHKDMMLGKEGDAFNIAMQTFVYSRPYVGAEAVGIALDYDAEIFMRDAKIFQIFEGTVEAQKMIVSGAILR